MHSKITRLHKEIAIYALSFYDTLANKQEGGGYYAGSCSGDTVVLLFCDTTWSHFIVAFGALK